MPQEGYTHAEFPKWLHHPEGAQPSKLVLDEDAEAAVLKEWHVEPNEIALATDSARNILLKRAEAVSLKVDNRWSDKKLAEEVDKAEAPVNLTTYKAPLA